MILFPAIDIMKGKAVRLKRGVRTECDIYGDPVDRAYRFREAGATRLHIVDLDAAFDGSSENDDVIKEIAAIRGLTSELGGGNRTEARVGRVLEELGISRAIVGSAAVSDQAFTLHCVKRYGARIVLGLDALAGRLRIKGWVEDVDVAPLDCALFYREYGVTDIVYTDVSRDGMLQGVNVKETAKLQHESAMNVIASGGIRDLRDLCALKEKDVYGAILGRSLYEGTLDLKEALALC